MKKALTILAAVTFISGCFAGCGTETITNKSEAKLSNEEQLNSVEMAESKQVQAAAEEKTSPIAVTSGKNDVNIPSLVEKTPAKTERENKNNTSASNTQAPVGDLTKHQTNKAKPKAEYPTTSNGTTIVGTFVIKKVSGTYLELYKLMGNDTEKLVYCCDLGDFSDSADMEYKVGDYIVLRYDREIAETYPLRLTVREIYPPEWNN